MILYFSATGNSLAVARQLAERLNEQLMPLIEAVRQVVEEHADPGEIVRDLMGRRLKQETI